MPFPILTDADFQVEVTKVTSTDASGSVALYTKTLPAQAAARMLVTIVGTKVGGTDRAMYSRVIDLWNNAGTATFQGSVAVPIPDKKSDGTWTDPAVSVSGAVLTIASGGKAATTVVWRARVEFVTV